MKENMIQKFEAFLRYHNIEEEFTKNNQKHTEKNRPKSPLFWSDPAHWGKTSQWIDQSFFWYCTPEKDEYWYEIHKEWVKCCENNTFPFSDIKRYAFVF